MTTGVDGEDEATRSPGGAVAPTVADTGDLVDVVELRWPADVAVRDRLVAAQVPRLLVVDRGCAPPPCSDRLEDWVRPDADAIERYVRRERLRRRAACRAPAVLDADGLLHRGRRWVALPPGELGMLTAMLAVPGATVGRAELAAAMGAGGPGDGRAVDNAMRRLRQRLAPLGLAVCAVRGLGFLLEVGDLPV